MKDDH